MDLIDLGIYKNFKQLLDKLAYLYTTSKIYVSHFDANQKINVYMFYDSSKKKYNFYFNFEDDKISNLFTKIEKELTFSEIPNKATFVKLLKTKIDKLIKILQTNWYKLSYKPEVWLFDLEMLSQEIDLENKEMNIEENTEEEKEELKKNKKILNQVLLYHEILAQYLYNDPKLKDWNYNIKIWSIKKENLELFPKQDKLFKNVELSVTAIPNIYFPWIIVIKVNKTFEYKNIFFSISYTWQELSKNIWLLAKAYYDKYKKHQDDRILNFWLKLVEIIKNPYSTWNLTKTTASKIIVDSNCQKCWSSSSMFKVKLSNVDIKTFMWKFELSTLYPENIMNYKDILSINCLECNNNLIQDKELISWIKKRRNFLTSENWISHETWKPLLDSDWEEVIVKYDIVELDVEFDITNPMLPKMEYNKILNVWKIIWWSDKELKRSKTFYDR